MMNYEKQRYEKQIKIMGKYIKELEKNGLKKLDIENIIKETNGKIEINRGVTKKVAKKYPKNTQEYGLFLMFSDQHIEKCVEEGNIEERYDFDIAKSRYFKMVEETLNCSLQSKNLVILEGGDLFDGIIHTNYYTNYQQPISDIFTKLTQLYLDIFEILYKKYKKIELHATFGNHDRFLDTKTVKHGDTFAKLFWINLQMIVKQSYKNITINFYESGFGLFQYNNANIVLTHGHLLGGNVKTLNTPTRMEKLKNVLRKLYPDDNRFKHLIVGHFHSPMDFTNYKGGKTIVCGSLVGTDGYAYSLGIIGKPTQLLMYLDIKGNFTYINHVEV